MAKNGGSSTIFQIVGANVKKIRTQAGWTQDELARRARVLGLRWSRSSIAAFEGGKKTIDIEDLLFLTITLRATVGDLFEGDARGLVSRFNLELEDVRVILTSADSQQVLEHFEKRASELDREASERERELDQIARGLDRDRSRLDEIDSELISIASKREAEQKAARRVGIPVEVLVGLSLERWGKPLTEERDERAEAAAKQEESSRSLQALRGHITRQLLAELEQKISAYLEAEGGD